MKENKYIGSAAFYKKTLMVVVPIMVQNGITNFVGMLDNIMVGQVGTEQMTGVAIGAIMAVFSGVFPLIYNTSDVIKIGRAHV